MPPVHRSARGGSEGRPIANFACNASTRSLYPSLYHKGEKIVLQTSLCLASAAVVINFWLVMRIGKLRHANKVSIGDGGIEIITRRMRAQANFIEQTPLTLILFGLVEAAGRGGQWLAPLGAAFILSRVAHAYGMEENGLKSGRPIGMLVGMVTQITLVVSALGAATGRF